MKRILLAIALALTVTSVQARDYWDARREIQERYERNGGGRHYGGNYYNGYYNGYYHHGGLNRDEKLILGAALIYSIAKNAQQSDPAYRERKAFEQGLHAREREIQAERERRAYECGYYGNC